MDLSQSAGSLKKVGALKIVHEKYKKKTKAVENAAIPFHKTFDNAVKLDPMLKPHIGKAQEDLTPLSVLRLFERISDEVCLITLIVPFGE